MNARTRLQRKFQKMFAKLEPDEEETLENFFTRWSESGSLQFYRVLERECHCLKKVFEIGKALNSRGSLSSLLALILDKAIEIVQAERGFILMAPEGDVAVARNFDKEWVREPEFKVSRSVASKVLNTGKPLVAENAQNDPNIKSNSIRNMGLKSVLCVPLVAQNDVLGALYLDNRFCRGAFSKHHLFILQAFAEQAACALQDARLRDALRAKHDRLEALAGQMQRNSGAKIAEQIACEQKIVDGVYRFGKMISYSKAMNRLFQIAKRTAIAEAPALITGESGTGKELLAQAIHNCSTRCQGNFVEENCGAISPSLLESELFGYVSGAFTGASKNRKGLFEMADGGTLFLDEIGEMSLDMQARLLKVLENKSLRPLGAEEWRKVDVWVISATHRDLPQMIRERKFREDLWYRLRVMSLEIPPLRDRPEDIPLLIEHFLSRHSEQKRLQIGPQAMEILQNYHWPGNVRQLEHEILRLTAMKNCGEKIRAGDINAEIARNECRSVAPGLSLKEATMRFEQNYIIRAIDEAGGNKSQAAKMLGLSRRGLYNKLCVDKAESQ